MSLSDEGEQYAFRAAVPVMAACSLFLFSVNAGAREVCTLTIRADGVGESWTRELEIVRADLASRKDVDDCASIQLEPAPDGARMIVVLKDGRTAQRAVASPLDLRAVATAFVLLPPGELHPATTPEPAPVDADRAPEHPRPTLDDVDDVDDVVPMPLSTKPPPPMDSNTPMASQVRTNIDLGAIGGARWSGTSPAGSVGLFADVRLSEWMLEAYGRWDSYGAMTGSVGYTMQTFDLGADAGRNVRIGGTSLALLAGPSVVSLSQKLQSTPPPVYVSALNPKTGAPIGGVTPSARDGLVVRLGGVIRWTVVSQGRLRLFVSADGEVDMMSDPGNRVPGAFAATGLLPIWSAGLSVGGAASVWP